MSRIGKNPIIIPEGVTVSIDESVITGMISKNTPSITTCI